MHDASESGARVYTDFNLRFYDWVVLDFSCGLIWRCPKSNFVRLYQRNAGIRHLDVGVGTGQIPARAGLSKGEQAELHLLDLNPAALRMAAGRLAEYSPTTYHSDALQKIPLGDASVDSVGSSMLLHCMPGTIAAKSVFFDEAARVLRPEGRFFGSTILSLGVPVTRSARALMDFYNRKGIFDNAHDSLEALTEQLDKRFTDVRVAVKGNIAMWEGIR